MHHCPPGFGPGWVEYRAVDAAVVSPYLMSGALLRVFDDGFKRKLNPGDSLEPKRRFAAMEQRTLT